MSNLLKSVTSKLAQSGLGAPSSGSGNGSDDDNDNNAWQAVESPAESEDDELVGVVSQPGTIPPTPLGSRPSSPPPGSKKRSGLDKSWTSVPSTKVKNKKDPLRAFGSEISQRIFLQLPLSSLLRCSCVCKKWRKSATINYSYFQIIQSSSFTPSSLPPLGTGGAKWTRRESKTDWRSQYLKVLKIERRDSERSESNSLLASGTTTPSRTQRYENMGIKTNSERREEEWKEQDRRREEGYSKEEMREYYKGLGNKGGKVRNKSGKGGNKTGSLGDGGIWE